MVTVFAWLAFACFGGAALGLIALHLIPSWTDPVAEGVSAYGLGPTARLYQFQVVLSGAGGVLLATALAGSGASPIATGALVVYGLTRAAIAVYPTDPPGSAMTPTGRNHVLLAAIAFLAVAIGAPASGGAAPLMLLAVLVTITSLGSFGIAVLPRTVRFYGLAQRAFYVATFAWGLSASFSAATS